MRSHVIASASAFAMSIGMILTSGPAARAASAPARNVVPAIDLVLALPLRNESELETLVANQTDAHSPLYHHFLTPAQFRAAFGPDPAQVRAVTATLQTAGFTIRDVTSQAIRVRGTADSIRRAFGVSLAPVQSLNGAMRLAASGPYVLPKALAAAGATIVGLQKVAPKHTYFRTVATPDNRYSNAGGYWYDDLKQAYRYPSFTSGVIGKGVKIGILIDSNVDPKDLATYLQAENYTAHSGGVPLPSVSVRVVLGGAPETSPTNPYNANDYTAGVEAALDLQQSLGSAPGASGIVYDIPTLDDDAVIAGYLDIVEDNVVDIVSSSFGNCELSYGAAYNGGHDETGILRVYHSIFLQGNAQGITFVASSGDGGAKACPTPGYVNPPHLAGTFVTSISSPADDPNVTAVGGTNLVTSTPPPNSPSLASKYIAENAYGDPQLPYDVDGYGANVSGGIWGSGSGPSAYFGKPGYQRLVETHQKNRSIPDISMHMGGCPGGTSILGGPNAFCGYAAPLFDHAPRSYVWAYYGPIGLIGLIGTSASSPEFAGLLALGEQRLHSRLGNANTIIYALAAADPYLPGHVYHQGIPGYNGVLETFTHQSGYDPILGVGTPIAENLLGLFGAPAAGDPQTASNP